MAHLSKDGRPFTPQGKVGGFVAGFVGNREMQALRYTARQKVREAQPEPNGIKNLDIATRRREFNQYLQVERTAYLTQ